MNYVKIIQQARDKKCHSLYKKKQQEDGLKENPNKLFGIWHHKLYQIMNTKIYIMD